MSDNVQFKLASIAHGRSGDKGNHSNIAIIAYTRAGFDWLTANLTAEVVAAYGYPWLGAIKGTRWAPTTGSSDPNSVTSRSSC